LRYAIPLPPKADSKWGEGRGHLKKRYRVQKFTYIIIIHVFHNSESQAIILDDYNVKWNSFSSAKVNL